MLKFIKYALITLISITFFKCQKAIDIDQEKIEIKMVLNSILSSQSDTIWVKLTESRDLLYAKSEFPKIKDAKISLYENEILIGDLIEFNQKYYLAYNVIEGKKYKINIEHPDFKNITASTTVPKHGSLIKVNGVVLSGDISINLKIEIEDSKNTDNYYAINVLNRDSSSYVPYVDTLNPDTNFYYVPNNIYYNSYNCTKDFIVEYPQINITEGNNCYTDFLFTDKLFKNATHTFKANINRGYYGGGGQDNLGAFVITKLNTYNYDYYSYFISKDIFKNNLYDPFSEPIQVYNNIENGYGIFAAIYTEADTSYFE